MSGEFKLLKRTSFFELKEGDVIPESDYSTLLPNGDFLQFKHHDETDNVGAYEVNPGLFKICKSMQKGYYLESTSFIKDSILEEFVNTKEVEEIVDCFFNNLHVYKEMGMEIPKRNLLLWGAPGCHAADTKILMFDGTTKNVEDVRVGDLLMGPDSKPREVLKLAQGREPMVRISPIKGDSFIVNMNHILHLTPSGSNCLTKTPVNITFSDYLKQSNYFKERYKLTRTGVEFTEKTQPIPSYILGTWLGDGHSESTRLTSIDKEIINEWENYSKSIGLIFNNVKDTISYSITRGNTAGYGKKGKNPFLTSLQELELINNKHIPLIYKTGSKQQRLELLAGIIDTDGSLSCNGYDYISISNRLANDVVYLARSLGFAAYISECQKSSQNGTVGIYYRVSISGDISEVPVKLERKKGAKREQIKSVLRTGFSYEILEENNYYGFTLDNDHLYLTDDFTIHHNTGKSTSIAVCARKYLADSRTAIITWDSNAFEAYEVKMFISKFKYENVDKIILVVEDIGGVENEGYKVRQDSSLLSLLDNTDKTFTIPVMIISTTNHPENLGAAIANRSGRFDDKIEVGYPNSEARKSLLKFFAKEFCTEEALELIGSNKCAKFPPSDIREVYVRSRLRSKSLVEVINTKIKEIEEYNKAFTKQSKLGL